MQIKMKGITMEEKLKRIYDECVKELKSIGMDILNSVQIGTIDISVSKRNNKRYGCCKQEEPDIKTKYIEKIGNKRIIRYAKFNKHHIEISPWLLKLDESIIKNTIIHEIIHCLPNCNNHGEEFKRYAKYINNKLGYNISRVGNKKEDYIKSNVEYEENEKYNYHIKCTNCGQSFFRKRLNKNYIRRYRCGKCGSKFEVEKL